MNVTLFQSIIAREKFELVLQKATELGVNTFYPFISLRTQTSLTTPKMDRWQKILQEASEQSERGKIPEIKSAIKFEDALKQLDQFDISFLAWEKEDLTKKLDLKRFPTAKNIALFIGPEGGFTEEEIQTAKNAGAETISLGPRILRSETAGIILPALILN